MDNFASLDTPGDPGGVKVVELSVFEKYISCFVTKNRSVWWYTVFPHIRPEGIIFLCSLQIGFYQKTLNFSYIKLLELRVLLELWVLFEGGSYTRKYGSWMRDELHWSNSKVTQNIFFYFKTNLKHVHTNPKQKQFCNPMCPFWETKILTNLDRNSIW